MSRNPYSGSSRKLLIAFDIGTTYSGVSFCLLDPGEIPKIVVVTSFPGQQHAPGSSKIPSVMYYDQNGRMKAAGAECDLDDNIIARETPGANWTKVSWFKLRLKPSSMPAELKQSAPVPLPPGVSLVTVFGDYMGYLLECTKTFFVDRSDSNRAQWPTLLAKAEFIIGHPNSWEGAQQARLRRAAIKGNLIPDTPEDRARIHFVTEGEASLHFCLFEKLVNEGLQVSNRGFLIADLGGGTLDFSSYKLISADPIQVEETAGRVCELQGSALVKVRAIAYLKETLSGSRYGETQQVNAIADRFDETTKRQFVSATRASLVSFGTIQDRDPAYNISNGRLMIPGAKMAELYEPSVKAAYDSIVNSVRGSTHQIHCVYLVGGFSASPYLVAELRSRLEPHEITVSVVDGQTAKAVANGAITYFMDHYVQARIAQMTYGTKSNPRYDPLDAEHFRRRHDTYELASGRKQIRNGYSVILAKGTLVKESQEFTKGYFYETNTRDSLRTLSTDIIAYTGPPPVPRFINAVRNPYHLKQLCTIRADTSSLPGIVQQQTGPSGNVFWTYDYDIIIHFGLTEIKAQVAWEENGNKRRSDAQIIYDEMAEDEGDEDPEEELASMFRGAFSANVPGQDRDADAPPPPFSTRPGAGPPPAPPPAPAPAQGLSPALRRFGFGSMGSTTGSDKSGPPDYSSVAGN